MKDLEEIKYYTVYKITNIVTNQIYIGIHETNNIDDNYMGSGVYLGYAKKKYGLDRFKKEILHLCETREDMIRMEKELVDIDFLNRPDVYNLALGGGYSGGARSVKVRDCYGDEFIISSNNVDFLSGELLSVNRKRNRIINEATQERGWVEKDENPPEGWIYLYKKDTHPKINNEKHWIQHEETKKMLFVDTKEELRDGWVVMTKYYDKTTIAKKGMKAGQTWIHNDLLQINKLVEEDHVVKYIKKGWVRGKCKK